MCASFHKSVQFRQGEAYCRLHVKFHLGTNEKKYEWRNYTSKIKEMPRPILIYIFIGTWSSGNVPL